jgi:transposase
MSDAPNMPSLQPGTLVFEDPGYRHSSTIRPALTQAQWARIAPLLCGKPEDRGSTGRDNRMFVEAVLWVARTGAAWRGLPPEFGAWNTVFRRHRRWLVGGVWQRVFEALGDDLEFGYVLEGRIIRPARREH